MIRKILKSGLAVVLFAGSVSLAAADDSVKLLNVSYDPTRELYQDYNKAFAANWKEEKGQDGTVDVSNGGSGKQARAILDGLEADVATLGLSYDIDVLSSKGNLLSADWQSRLPYNSAPYTSTVVLLVRKGNPKNIKDWDDLARPDVQVITPNPKTSAGGRWAFIGAWGYALTKTGSESQARDFVTKVYKNVPVLDSGARGSTTTFVERGIGDVLLAWENEALLSVKELGPDKFQVVYPSQSILAEPPVSVVDQVVDKRGTRAVAEGYLQYLYTPEGQEIAARNFYRPRLDSVAKKYASTFPKVKLFTLADVLGHWHKTQSTHFSDGGVFDQIYQPNQ